MVSGDVVAYFESQRRAEGISQRFAVRERLYATLSKTQRQYMEMRNGKGMSLDEISAATGRPKSSIKVTISAARRQLLEKLEKEVL